jgi:hypothetical protein
MQNPDRYVLKPQREGGGNNLYGQNLVEMLQQGLAAGGGEGLAAFILMQRIVPPPQRSVFVRGGAWAEDESLSELGIYGTFLKVGQQVRVTVHPASAACASAASAAPAAPAFDCDFDCDSDSAVPALGHSCTVSCHSTAAHSLSQLLNNSHSFVC